MQIVKKICNFCKQTCTKSLRLVVYNNDKENEVEICYNCISRMYDESGQTKFTYTNPYPYVSTATDKKLEVTCWNGPVNSSL